MSAPRSRKNRRYRSTGHRAGIALAATGSVGKSVRAWKRMDRLRRHLRAHYVTSGVDDFGNLVQNVNHRKGKHPARKPKDKK